MKPKDGFVGIYIGVFTIAAVPNSALFHKLENVLKMMLLDILRTF